MFEGCGRRRVGTGRRRPSRLAALLLLFLLSGPGCARTVNDYLGDAVTGSPDAVKDAIHAVGHLLARKEAAGIEFDEGDRAGVAYLEKMARTSSIRVHRAMALAGIGKLRSVKAPDLFLEALEDPFWLSRFYAVQALRSRPTEELAGLLTELLDREKQPELRLEIVKTLGSLGGDEALKSLYETYLQSSLAQPGVRIHAYWALRDLTGLSHSFNDRSSWEKSYRERFEDDAAAQARGTGS